MGSPLLKGLEIKSGYKYGIMAVLLAGSSFLTLYYHIVLDSQTVFTHLFYLPIVLGCFWWKRKGLAVPVFLAALLLLSDAFFLKGPVAVDDIYRSIMFVAMGIVVAELSRWIEKREVELRKGERKYRELVESLNEGIWAVDGRGGTTYVNDRMAEMLGCGTEELLGASIYGFLDEGFIERAKVHLESVGGDANVREDFEFTRKDGSRMFAIVQGSPVTGDGGERVGAILGVVDVTARRKVEEELREYREHLEEMVAERTAELRRLEMAVEQSSEGIVIVDLDGYVQYLNTAWAAMHRFRPDELKGKHFHVFHTPAQVETSVKGLLDQVRRAGMFQGEVEHVRSDGKIFPTWMTCSLVRDRDGMPMGFVVIARDITETKKAEEELQKINTELAGFAHTVSHDLEGPLAAIGMAGITLRQLLGSSPEDNREEIEEVTGLIIGNVDKSTVLIRDLLELAEAGQDPGAVDDVEVGDVIESIIDERAADIEDEGIEVRVGAELGSMRLNPVHAYQLFSNLIGNAIKHNSSETPVIEVARLSSDEEDSHRFLVRDNGKGVPDEVIEKIFAPFFKIQSDGTGIGLSTVEKIVKMYDGYIRAYNDGGACFEFMVRDSGD